MKKERQQAILEIIQSNSLETQEDLIEKLNERGFSATQATISRDIRELRIVKESDGLGGYRYTSVRNASPTDISDRLELILREGGRRVDYVNNIVFIHTLPGLASAAAAAMDYRDHPDMLGCVAGDDSVMIVMRSSASAAELTAEIAGKL